MLERRSARRFKVEWNVTVKGKDRSGARFNEDTTLRDLSSCGAYVYLHKLPKLGARLDVLIEVPFKKNNTMKYSAVTLRVEPGKHTGGVAIRFDASRPTFKEE